MIKVTKITYYINLKDGTIKNGGSIPYYERFKSGNWAHIGKLDCRCAGFKSRKVQKNKYEIYRLIRGKEKFYSLIGKENIISK